MLLCLYISSFFFFNDTATTEIYTLSLHDALPICHLGRKMGSVPDYPGNVYTRELNQSTRIRSEEHTSELQSPCNLVCRLLLEKKKKTLNRLSTTLSDHIPTRTSRHDSTTPLACGA